jgi:hypothetical protein
VSGIWIVHSKINENKIETVEEGNTGVIKE